MGKNPEGKTAPFHAGYAALFTLGLISLTWFRGDFDVVAGYDFATSLHPGDELKRALFLWDERLYAGAMNMIGTATIPYLLLQYFFESAAGSLHYGQMFFFYVLFTLPAVAMLAFLKEAFEDRDNINLLAFFGALFYMFNPYVFAKWNRGELISLYAYGLLPLILYIIERGVKRHVTFGYIVLFSAAFFLYPATLGHAADFLIITAVAAVYGVWRISGTRDSDCRKRAFFLAVYAAILSAWWAFPLFMTRGALSGAASVLGGGGRDLVDYYSSWAGLLKMFKLWFTPLYPTGLEFGTQFYRPGTILVPLAAFSALFLRTDKRVVFFAWVGIAGLWLSKGTGAPFGFIYSWLYENLPFFFIFRAPSRCFPALYTFALAVLFGYAVSAFLTKADRSAGAKAASRLAPVIAVIVLLNGWPLFSRDHVFRSKGDSLYPGVFIKVPEYYRSLDAVLEKKDGHRLHSFNDRAYLNYTWGYSSTDILPRVVDVPQTLSYTQELSFGGAGFSNIAGNLSLGLWAWDFGGLEKTLSLLGARHIALIDDVMRRYLPDYNSIEMLEEVLKTRSGIEKVWESGPVRLYENSNALPHFYTARYGETVDWDANALKTLNETGYLEKSPVLFFKDQKIGVPEDGIEENVFIEKMNEKNKVKAFTLIIKADKDSRINPVELEKGAYRIKAAFPQGLIKEKKIGFKADFSSVQNHNGWACLENCGIYAKNNIIIRSLEKGMPARAAFDLNGSSVDLENHPFLSITGLVKSGRVNLVLGLDTDSDGKADDILETTFSDDAYTFNAGEAVRKKWGYPGRKAYKALWAAFELPPASVTEDRETHGIAISSMEFFHYMPAPLVRRDENLSMAIGKKRFALGNSPLKVDLQEGAKDIVFDNVPEKALLLISKGAGRENNDGPEIRWVKNDPVSYSVSIEGAKVIEDFWLVFNESFDPGWKAYLAAQSGRNLIKEHYQVNGFANAWRIHQDEEGGKMEINIEFAPQRYLKTGALISMAGAAIVMALVPAISLRKRRMG